MTEGAPAAEVTIRPAELADAGRIPPLYEWLFEPPGSRPSQWDPQRAVASLEDAIESDASLVLLAVCADRFVGLCTAYDDIDSVRFGRRVWVEDMMVHPDHRSRGIGKRLLDEARRWAQARGATRLQLDSSEARTDAHRFYDREQPDWRSFAFGWWL